MDSVSMKTRCHKPPLEISNPAAPVARSAQITPGLAVILAHRQAGRIETGPYDQPFLAGGIDDAVDGGRLLRGRPRGGHGQAAAPGQAAVRAALVHNGAFAVALRIDAEDCLSVLEQHRSRMPEILAWFAVHGHLPIGFAGQVKERDGVATRRGGRAWSRNGPNNEYLGKTPFTLKIFGDKDGTFHNFGRYHYTLKAYPVRSGQQPQTKEF